MLIYAVLIVLLVGVDQLTKYLAAVYLAPVGTASFLPGIMELRYVENVGMAFSMLSGRQTLLIVVTIITIGALVFATTFINFAVFNVADCFVCIGGALWVLAVMIAERKKKKEQKEPADGEA